MANPVIVEIAGHRQPAAHPGPQPRVRRRAGHLRLRGRRRGRPRSSPRVRPARWPPTCCRRAQDRRDVEPRRRPGHRRAGRDQPGRAQRVLHGRRRRLGQRDARHQGRQHRAEGHRHLQPDHGLLGDQAGPADRAGQGHERPRGERGAGVDHAGLGDDHQGERRHSTCRWASSPDAVGGLTARGRHGGLRLHGRGPLAGLAHRAAASSTCRCGRSWPRSAAATRHGRAAAARKLGWRSVETDWSALLTPRRRPARRRLHARATRTPRSRSPRWRQASTCCARSRWPTRSPRRGRWSPRPSGPRPAGVRSMVGLQLPAGARASRWPGGWWPRGGSGRSGTCARSTCRTGSSTRSSRWCGGCRRTRPGRARWATSARTSSTWRSSSPATGSPGSSALTETFVKERPLPAAAQRALRVRQRGARPGHRRRRGAVHRPLRRRGAGQLRGHPVRHRTQERDPAGDQRQRAASLAFDFESMNELCVLRRRGGPRDGRLPPHPGHRADPPVRGRLVAAGPPARLRALVHPRGGRLGHATWPRAATRAVVRRRPAGAAGAGRRRARSAAAGSGWQPVDIAEEA